jgi:hypothetical protein
MKKYKNYILLPHPKIGEEPPFMALFLFGSRD